MCVNDELCVNLYKYVTISIVSFFVTSNLLGMGQTVNWQHIVESRVFVVLIRMVMMLMMMSWAYFFSDLGK